MKNVFVYYYNGSNVYLGEGSVAYIYIFIYIICCCVPLYTQLCFVFSEGVSEGRSEVQGQIGWTNRMEGGGGCGGSLVQFRGSGGASYYIVFHAVS